MLFKFSALGHARGAGPFSLSPGSIPSKRMTAQVSDSVPQLSPGPVNQLRWKMHFALSAKTPPLPVGLILTVCAIASFLSPALSQAQARQ